MVIICIKCHGQMDAPQSALNKKVRCPICSEIFVAALPKAEVIEDDTEVVKEVVKDESKKVVKEAPVEDTAGGELPIVLSAGPGPAPSAKSEEVDPSDPLGQLAAAGLKPRRRRKSAVAGGKRATDARKALASFAAAPSPQVHWPGGKAEPAASGKPEPAPKRGRPKAPTRYRRMSKDVWYVIAGDYEYGPYTPQVILAAIQAGKISRGVLMRHALTDSVISAGRILELLPKQKRPAAERKPAKTAAPRAKSPTADAAGSALDSMAKRPSKPKRRGKGSGKAKRKQSPRG